jgi:hypothetical protein
VKIEASALSPLGGPNYWDPAPLLSESWIRSLDRHTALSPPSSDSPSTSMKTMSCGPAERFTQIADATDPVRGLTPCQRPPAGWRFRRLVVCSRLHSSKPSRKDGHDILRRRGPAMFLFDPRDPAVLAKSVEARHRSHHVPLCVKIFDPLGLLEAEADPETPSARAGDGSRGSHLRVSRSRN